MANYHVRFNITIPLTDEQKEYAIETYKKVKNREKVPLPEDFPKELSEFMDDWHFTLNSSEHAFFISDNSQINTSIYPVGHFIRHLIKTFHLPPVLLQYSIFHHNSPDKEEIIYLEITEKVVQPRSSDEWLIKMGSNANIK